MGETCINNKGYCKKCSQGGGGRANCLRGEGTQRSLNELLELEQFKVYQIGKGGKGMIAVKGPVGTQWHTHIGKVRNRMRYCLQQYKQA